MFSYESTYEHVIQTAWSGFPPCAYAETSPDVGSLAGREFAQSLGTRLLVLVLHGAGVTRNPDFI